MKLEAGKRYVRRDGQVTGVITLRVSSGTFSEYCFADIENGHTFLVDGRYNYVIEAHPYDCMEEYVEPTPATTGGPYVSVDVYNAVVAERDQLLWEKCKRPPLGILPRWVWLEQRQAELCDAIGRSEGDPDFRWVWELKDIMRELTQLRREKTDAI